MMETYGDFAKPMGEVAVIAYPVIYGQKKAQKTTKSNKLYEFYERFQSQGSKHERPKYIGLSKNKRFRIAQNTK